MAVAERAIAKNNNLAVLILLALGHLATDLSQGALPVILPYLKESFNLSYTVAGIIPLVSNFSSSLIQPLFGMLSDRYKCLWLLPLGCFSAALGIGLLGVIDNYVLVILLILITGLGIAAYHPEGAKVAHFAAGGQRASAMSVFSVGGNLGFAFGSIMMAILLAKGGLPYSLFMLLPGTVMAAMILLYMRRIPYHSTREITKGEEDKEVSQNQLLPVITLIGVIIVRSWTQYGLSYYIPFYYINYLQADKIHAGNILFLYLLAGAFGTLVGGPLSDRFGRKRVIIASMLLMPPLVLTFIFAKTFVSMVALFLAGAVLVSSFSTTIVLGQEYLPNNVGVASGLMIGLAVGTGGIGVIVLGALADATSEYVAIVTIALIPLAGALLAAMLPKEKNI